MILHASVLLLNIVIPAMILHARLLARARDCFAVSFPHGIIAIIVHAFSFSRARAQRDCYAVCFPRDVGAFDFEGETARATRRIKHVRTPSSIEAFPGKRTRFCRFPCAASGLYWWRSSELSVSTSGALPMNSVQEVWSAIEHLPRAQRQRLQLWFREDARVEDDVA